MSFVFMSTTSVRATPRRPPPAFPPRILTDEEIRNANIVSRINIDTMKPYIIDANTPIEFYEETMRIAISLVTADLPLTDEIAQLIAILYFPRESWIKYIKNEDTLNSFLDSFIRANINKHALTRFDEVEKQFRVFSTNTIISKLLLSLKISRSIDVNLIGEGYVVLETPAIVVKKSNRFESASRRSRVSILKDSKCNSGFILLNGTVEEGDELQTKRTLSEYIRGPGQTIDNIIRNGMVYMRLATDTSNNKFKCYMLQIKKDLMSDVTFVDNSDLAQQIFRETM